MNLYLTPIPSSLEKVSLPLCKDIAIIDWRKSNCEFFDWYYCNRHHWTIRSAFGFLLNIAKEEHFELAKNIDFCKLHVKNLQLYSSKMIEKYNVIGSFKCNNITLNQQNVLTNSLMWIDKKKWYKSDAYTDYHEMFYGAHSISITENLDESIQLKSILVIADSMSIAIAYPLIASFQKCVIIDGRHYADIANISKLIDINSFDVKFALCTLARYDLVIQLYKYLIGEK